MRITTDSGRRPLVQEWIYGDLVETHVDRKADVTIAAQPVTIEDASAVGILLFDRAARSPRSKRSPKRERLEEIGRSLPSGSTFALTVLKKPFVASMGITSFPAKCSWKYSSKWREGFRRKRYQRP